MATFNLVSFLARSGITDSRLESLALALPFRLSKDGPWIAGGAVRRTLIGQPLDSDVDVFCANQLQMDVAADLVVS